MADVVPEGAGFWLPAEFFADDDIGQENLVKHDLGSDFCFPTEFPYDFQAENLEHVEAAWVMSTSPQSTLGNWSGGSTGGSSIGSPNSAPLPSAQVAGKNDAVVDLICKAAGQVAKLKLNSGDVVRPAGNLGLFGPPRSPDQVHSSNRTLSPSIFQPTRAPPITAKRENPVCGMWYGPQQQMYDYMSGKAVGRMDQAAWPVKQNPTRNIGTGNRAFLLGGPGGGVAAKRECAGTGVFLPRVYGSSNASSCNAYSSESQRKPVYPTSFLQESNVDPLFKNFENMKAALVQSLPRSQPETRFNGGFMSDYDLLMARRNSIMLQYRKSLLSEKWAMGRENRLPQEWNQ
ncbi:uncharacterized protein [Primulina eburnea]|uniref:uncharacterized protein isoform X2 n=1 Tax=Primulina eburnea TaxID=1245227 RepID=UPI003C6C4D59